MPLLYDIGLGLYHTGIRIAAPFVPKARAWLRGRKALWGAVEMKRKELHGCIWMHCASVGEFEQGRPVLEAVKARHPQIPVLLTFYSPSGYEACQNHALANCVAYLPADGAANARRFIDLVRPRAVIWVKYEFWYHWLHALKERSVPVFLISAIFRKDQSFFRWFGGAYRSMLKCFTHLFVQDDPSRALLASIGVSNVTVSGDTRFDRVMAIVRSDEDLPAARAFRVRAGKDLLIVAGSTWSDDDHLLGSVLMDLVDAPGAIVAPHEFDREKIPAIAARYSLPHWVWSQVKDDAVFTRPAEWPPSPTGTLVVDRMGLLARLYKYADIAYVGGGFGDGIHSLLEAAAWGKPVIFGPKHHKFAEAKGLIDAGGGFEVKDAHELRTVLDRLLDDEDALAAASRAAGEYVRARTGATERIVNAIGPAIR